ncbi:MAG TPA: alpha-L-fucosidase [Candidatus Sulfotelmatobacter sp.]|nr:alpha-L-fucosidase [Candidatus Sulfotelmatobacter sp.]
MLTNTNLFKQTSFSVLLALCVLIPARAADTTGLPRETAKQHDARMAWWRDARFGMFIHWGLYSEAAGYWNGQPTSGAGEWIMSDMRIPRAQYETLAPRFDPVKFDADQWAETAHNAGMKYLVITSKHHEGFCMFKTAATDYNVVDAAPWHTDPLQALSKACRRHGIKFCVYYSIMDWHSPDQAPAYNPTSFVPGQKEAYIQYMETELKELITQYHPAVLWFDGQWMNGWTDEDGQRLYGYLRALDPKLIINNRIKGAGDYETPEQYIPPNGLPGRDWETCMTMNDTWGYKRDDNNWKSTQTLIRNVVDIASKGGNYLLNVGPTGEGLIPDASIERLTEIGRWMKVNGVAIYGTSASPFTRQLPWGRCTSRTSGHNTILYLHVFDWPADDKLVVPLSNKIRRASLLVDRSTPLRMENGEDGVTIFLPQHAPDEISSTVVVKLDGAPEVITVPILQNNDGTILLRASDAALHGSQIQYEPGPGHDNIGYWFNPDDSADWTFRVSHPGEFRITAEIAAPGPTSFQVSVVAQGGRHPMAPLSLLNETKQIGKADITQGYFDYKTVTMGRFQIPAAGDVTLAVHPVKDGWQPMNIRSIKLEPAR